MVDFHKRILFSDEAPFWVNGYVNKQNCRIWSEANPPVFVETPLHPEKLTVWCALWADVAQMQSGLMRLRQNECSNNRTSKQGHEGRCQKLMLGLKDTKVASSIPAQVGGFLVAENRQRPCRRVNIPRVSLCFGFSPKKLNSSTGLHRQSSDASLCGENWPSKLPAAIGIYL
ncbi:hypothetical protein TNCV_4360871 [Trichonephila clavipes]|nr:hypothetical protein TNCV_4360871 [Trichonephila clavipes]